MDAANCRDGRNGRLVLYSARRDERDACGRASREIVDLALTGLERLRHRGAVAADARTGDGGGLLVPIPKSFLLESYVTERPAGDTGAGGPAAALTRASLVDALASGDDLDRFGLAMVFLPQVPAAAAEARALVEQALIDEGAALAGWRPVPVRPEALGDRARATAPRVEQALFQVPDRDPEAGERRCFRVGRRTERAARAAGARLYLASISTRTVTYKALCAADQLAVFYPDLAQE